MPSAAAEIPGPTQTEDEEQLQQLYGLQDMLKTAFQNKMAMIHMWSTHFNRVKQP
jgi:exonuclease VII large subunit